MSLPDTHASRRRITTALFIAQSLFSAATIASFTLTPIIASELSGRDSLAGLPSTMTLIGRALLAYPAGWLLDRFGRRLGLSIGQFVGVFGAVVAIFSIVNGSFIGFLAGAALLGGARSAVDQGRYAAAEIFPSVRRAKIIGLIVFAGTIGAIGGPLLVDPAGRFASSYELADSTGPFMLAGLFMFLAGIVVFLFVRPDPLRLGREVAAAEHEAAGGGERAPARSLGQIFRQPDVILAVASMMIGQLVMTLLMVITPLHMSHHDHSTRAISWVIMAHTLGMFGLSGVNGGLVDRFGRRPMITAGAIILVSSSLLAPISTETVMLALALFLLGLGWNICFVAGSSLLSDQLAAGERGRVQGASEMTVALGAGLGSLGSGIIFDVGDIIAVSVVGLTASLLLFFLVVWRQIPRQGRGVWSVESVD